MRRPAQPSVEETGSPLSEESDLEGPKKILSAVDCRRLDESCRDFVFSQFKALRNPNQLFLLEVACSPDSLLSSEVERQGLRAKRCSLYNGFDLTSCQGVRRVLEVIEELRPEHVWIATECGAYSPMQNINQRTERQKNELAEKRRLARIQHTGGLIVAWYAQGCSVSWEWSRRCRAWKWGLFEEWKRTCKAQTSIISSCQVGLHCPKSGRPLGKEWRVESTSPTLAQKIHLPCPDETCKQNHAQAESRTLTDTAYYSPDFARRVVYHMQRDCLYKTGSGSLEAPQRDLQTQHGLAWDTCQCHRWKGSAPGLLCPKCLTKAPRDEAQVLAVDRGDKEPQTFTPEEKDRVNRQLAHLHKATGHGSYELLLKSLERNKADPRVLQLAKEFRCSTCEERRRPLPRRLSNLEVSTDRCKIVQFDAAMWTPGPGDGRNKCQFLVFVDEASRFAVAKLFRKDGGGHVTAKDIIGTFHEVWEPCFGIPEVLRADPDGACRSRELDNHFQEVGIETENIPADAHWKISVVERTIQWIKELMSKCATDHPDWPHEAILAQGVRTWNQSEPVRGFSPYQWMLGRAPDYSDRMFVPDVERLPGSLLHHPELGPAQAEAMRMASEKAFVDWQYVEKLTRARNSKAKEYHNYLPGDLVFYWRLQGKGRQGPSSGVETGLICGTRARILALETKHQGGDMVAGSSVWLVRGMRLVKASIEQLRPATTRETILHELTKESQQPPWTTTRLAEALGPHDYEDVSKDGGPPDPGSGGDATMDEEEELIPADSEAPRRRLPSKRPPPDYHSDGTATTFSAAEKVTPFKPGEQQPTFTSRRCLVRLGSSVSVLYPGHEGLGGHHACRGDLHRTAHREGEDGTVLPFSSR